MKALATAVIFLFSIGSVCAITAILCLMFGAEFTIGKAAVIWIAWYFLKVIKRKLDERDN